MKKVFASAIFITFVAIGVTWAAIWAFARLTFGYVPLSVLLESSVVALLIAFPTGLLLEAQKQQLRETSIRLRRSQSRLREALKELKRNSETDFLTSVLNRGSFLQRLEQIYDCDDNGALLMIDADDFKSINDHFGHAAGDRALTIIADIIADVISETGVNNALVGRMGGEEFAVFLPGADRRMARETAENIRVEINNAEFWPSDDESHPLSVSIGGELLYGFSGFAEALAKADERMYQAKRFGKNRCRIPQVDPLPSASTDPAIAKPVDNQKVA